MNGDDFSLSVTRVGDGTPHLGSGAQLRTNERRRLTLTTGYRAYVSVD